MNTSQGPHLPESNGLASLAADVELSEGDEGSAEEQDEEDLWSSGRFTFDIDAGWELQPDAEDPDRAVTRWCVIYTTVNDDRSIVAGVAAGFLGEEAFTMQRFCAEFDCESSDWVEGSTTLLRFEDRREDAITGEECEDFEDWLMSRDDGTGEAVFAAEQIFWRWHEGDADERYNGGSLLLRREHWDHPQCEQDDDMIRLASDCDPWVSEVCEHLGLTSAPVFDADEDED